jgi:TRAP-type transport system periplasmic protein
MRIPFAAALLTGAALILVPTDPVAADPVVIQINTAQQQGSFADAFLSEYKRRLDEELPGQLDVQIFYGNTLGSEEDVLQGMALGTHHASLAASWTVQINPRAAIFDLPYLFEDRAAVQRFADSPAGEMLAAGFDGTGTRFLALWDNGFRVITNSTRPIVTPEDLRGLRIRTPSNRQRVALFEALGANPTPMAFGETYSALDQGVIDGQENPAHVVHVSRFYEVQDYLSVSNHIYLPTFLLFSESFLASLDPEISETIERVAREVAPWTFDWGDETDRTVLEELEAGIEINQVDFAAFQDASAQLYEDPLFVDVPGKDMVDATLAVLRGN